MSGHEVHGTTACTCSTGDGLRFIPFTCPQHGRNIAPFKWPAFAYDDWHHDAMNGWVNRNDDPATPTETALLDDLALRRSDVARWEHLARIMKAQSDRWQEMAEDLWDELMAWHTDDCPFPDTEIGTPDDRCTCHRILAAKWDEITNAADYAPSADEVDE